ncbi:MAG: hypothetical protein AC479_05925 [miscellaneous Crenarchaeota group-6 archaeon AD8-1]|nr:MAG: hypothetical protein AC479_05925 [miscellaneous Crenarchaeota group-6 archaeon AD8-1]
MTTLSFTTSPKRKKRRGNSPIRGRCIEFAHIMIKKGYTTLPLKEAKALFQIEMGICDRTSLLAYFGRETKRSIRKIDRIARYSTGSLSFKSIELTQELPYKKGYFELLNIAHIEKRGKKSFFVLNQLSVVPQLSPQHKERTDNTKASKEKISLSTNSNLFNNSNGILMKENSFVDYHIKLETNNNIQDKREKLSLEKFSQKLDFSLPTEGKTGFDIS